MESEQKKEIEEFLPPLCEECGCELRGFHDCRVALLMAKEKSAQNKMDEMKSNLEKLHEINEILEAKRNALLKK